MSRPSGLTIQNCILGKRCSQHWLGLRPVDGSIGVRFCKECTRKVYFCQTDDELTANVRLQRCVAFQRENPSTRQPEGYVGSVIADYNAEDPKWQ